MAGLALVEVLVIGGLLLYLGGSPDEIAVTITGPEAASTTEPIESTPGDGPLVTGEGTGGGVIAVQVDNAPPAWPLVGVAEAPTLIEFPTEGGINRFVAVYPAGAEGLAGPVRSLRPIDVDLVPVFAPVLVTSGGRESIIEGLSGGGTEIIGTEFSSLFQSLGRPAPHDLFVDLETVDSLVANVAGPDGPLPRGNIDGEVEAGTVVLGFPGGTTVHFEHQDGVGYRRTHGTGELFEVVGPDGMQVPLDHDVVIALEAGEREAGWTDVNGVPVLDYDVIGGGRVTVFHDGFVVQGEWVRRSLGDGFEFRTDDGGLFGVPESRIYLAVLPRDTLIAFDP